ncbi:coiled-coil domain-containing protein 93-like [Lingula anatina]|uniref:Coiled-coil domain-containing protein 93 n=1 Tax=Lingula anatina TaxID=7574 RepID=A0A2R2MNV1_LINAN|nr:coiled-coil domain-containing protein 93-like [Lingula anatina]|eukprot:XP_023931883.1 coiled-coil domain-containing protein 93-like [Lingula anatina]
MASTGGSVFTGRGRAGSKLNVVYDAEGNEIEVVGGMTWCITTCNFDIDVDLLFQENSTIGQKIALTEKLVAVLPKMKCPHRIEPHQIQGLDFIHIYPVVQWLVKRAIETREEMGDYIRAFSVSQFNKNHKTPEDELFEQLKEKAVSSVSAVKVCISSTIQNHILKGRLTAGMVGSIVGLQAEEIQQMASEYAEKQAEVGQLEKQERVGGVQHHKRAVASLTKQIQNAQSHLDEVQTKHAELHASYVATQEKLKEAQDYSARVDDEMEKLTGIETGENRAILEKLRGLVAMNENLKKQEQEFKAHCKEEMARLQGNIESLKAEAGEEAGEDQERTKMIERQFEADKEKLHKIRLLLARKTREIAALQRKIDEVPSRAELSQYQRRFVELYNQVAFTHKETKQFYTLYNTLDDTKLYLNKEFNLLNSIHDNFSQAMSSPANKEQFLKQFEQIVEGVKQNRAKMDKKKQEEKMRRDQLNDQYLDLIEKQRQYFKTVKDFKEECRKNEILLAKVKR